MFKNMKIGWRMGLGFGLVLVFMIALILVSLNEMENSHERLERIVKINNVRLQLTHEMIDDVRNVSIALRNILLLKNIGKTQETKNKIAETRKEYDANFEKVQGLTPKEDTKAWDIISKIKASQDASRQLNNKVFDLALAGKYDNALDLMTKEVSPAVHQWIEHVDDLIKYNEEYNKMRHDQIEKDHIGICQVLSLDDQFVHFCPGQYLILGSLHRINYRIGLGFILQQDKNRAGMILSPGNSLRFGKRQKNNSAVKAISLCRVDAPDNERLLIYIAV